MGAELLAELFRWAGRNGFSLVKAVVTGGNARALRFYEKSGFTVSAEETDGSASGIVLARAVGTCA